MLTVMIILVVTAFILTILSAIGKTPLWLPVIILCLIALLKSIPLGN